MSFLNIIRKRLRLDQQSKMSVLGARADASAGSFELTKKVKRKRRRARYAAPVTLRSRLILRAKFLAAGVAIMAASTFELWYGIAKNWDEVAYADFPYVIGMMISLSSILWNEALQTFLLGILLYRRWSDPWESRPLFERSMSNLDRLRMLAVAAGIALALAFSFEVVDFAVASFGYEGSDDRGLFTTHYRRATR